MHYMRQRRHGDTETVGKAGRPNNFEHDILRNLFPEMSARTRAKYRTAMAYLDIFGDRGWEVLKLIGKARASAHSNNWTAFRHEAATLYAYHMATIGRWHIEFVSAEEYRRVVDQNQPELAAIYRRYIQEE